MDKKQNISPFLLIRPRFLIKNSISLFPSVLRANDYYQGLTSRSWLKNNHLRKIGIIRFIPTFLSDLFKRDILDIANLFEFFVIGRGHSMLGPGNKLYPSDISKVHSLIPHLFIKNIGLSIKNVEAGIIKEKSTPGSLSSKESMQSQFPLFPLMIHVKGEIEDFQANTHSYYSLPLQKEMFFIKRPPPSNFSTTHGMSETRTNEATPFHLIEKKPTIFPNMRSDFREDTGNPFYVLLYPCISRNIMASIIKNMGAAFMRHNKGIAIIKNIGVEIIKNKDTYGSLSSKEFMQPPFPLFSSMIHAKEGMEDIQSNTYLHYFLPFQDEMFFMKSPTHSNSLRIYRITDAGINEATTIHPNEKIPKTFLKMQSDFDEGTGNPFYTFLYPLISQKIGRTIIKNMESDFIKCNKKRAIIKNMGAEIIKGKRIHRPTRSTEFMQPPSPLFSSLVHVKGTVEEANVANKIQMSQKSLAGETNFNSYILDSEKDKNSQLPGSRNPTEIFTINVADHEWEFLISQLSESEGTPLGIFPRLTMERYFPHNKLSDIRIHRDNIADKATRALGADAFTLGQDIFFKADSFKPDSIKGLALLGHELVHVHQFEQGFTPSTFTHQAELERDALNAEWSLSGIHRGKNHLAGKGKTYFNNGANLSFSPINMELTPMQPLSTHLGSTNIEHFNISTGKGFSTNTQYLMRADEERDLAPETTMAESTTPPQAGENNIEDLSRQIYRYIGRQITLDKERRGIGQWGH